jgi:SAM-dependent methyltransferase
MVDREIAAGSPGVASEADHVRDRYARRSGDVYRYSLLNDAAMLAAQERQRAFAGVFNRLGWKDLATIRLLEVGCGTGTNLLEFLRFGFTPANLRGVELLGDSVERARAVLPPSIEVTLGDASTALIAQPGSQDVVLQSTVFSSLLDDAFQQRLADVMWNYLRPGGGVLWYDFVVGNPRNPDVRGVPVSRIRQLFPNGRLDVRRVTLAPPLARAVTRAHSSLYALFNTVPWLRTHVVAWIAKP